MPMSQSFPAPYVVPGRSRLLAAALIAVHAATVVVVLVVPLPAWSQAVLIAFVAAALARAVTEHVLHRGDAITRVTVGDGAWWVTTRRRPAVRARPLPECLILPRLVIATFALDDGRCRTLIVLPDNVPEAQLRRLRVWLRHGDAGTSGPK